MSAADAPPQHSPVSDSAHQGSYVAAAGNKIAWLRKAKGWLRQEWLRHE
jgi:hypothetical protein